MIGYLAHTLSWLAVHEFIALVLWSMVFVSIALTFSAVLFRSPRLMFAAAAFIVVPGILGILSIGIFFLMLSVLQVTAALLLRRVADRQPGMNS